MKRIITHSKSPDLSGKSKNFILQWTTEVYFITGNCLNFTKRNHKLVIEPPPGSSSVSYARNYFPRKLEGLKKEEMKKFANTSRINSNSEQEPLLTPFQVQFNRLPRTSKEHTRKWMTTVKIGRLFGLASGRITTTERIPLGLHELPALADCLANRIVQPNN